MEDLVLQIKLWQQTGDEVVLCIDANQDVYQGRLATMLSSPDIQLMCSMEPVLGTQVPNSHFRGTGKTSTILAVQNWLRGMPCAICTGTVLGIIMYSCPRYQPLHCLVVIIRLLHGCLLGSATCKISCIRCQYCASMQDLVAKHGMQARMPMAWGQLGVIDAR
jgi:hypothetical protein